jgi:hypothetical protein
MKEHEINKENNFIAGYYFEDPVIDEIIEFFEEEKDRQYEGYVFSVGKQEIRKDVKDSIDMMMPEPLRSKYIQYLQKSLDAYLIKYSEANRAMAFGVVNPVNIQKYNPGGGYKEWHCERGGPSTSDRHLVFITYLNDVKIEGGTEFMYQNCSVKAERGLTVIFPTDFTHTHRGIVAPHETKYIATGWYSWLPETY